ncbi:hypothetical protein Tsp_06555 [Trichinella spiralis]|uniref:hypothetical protein n=1 Tax=Trichinella spiralis TaxID=6334 RepID=UPI0001EFCECB|nr:hypothetical protein Tsp_06555 [Trichinella spiralis]
MDRFSIFRSPLQISLRFPFSAVFSFHRTQLAQKLIRIKGRLAHQATAALQRCVLTCRQLHLGDATIHTQDHCLHGESSTSHTIYLLGFSSPTGVALTICHVAFVRLSKVIRLFFTDTDAADKNNSNANNLIPFFGKTKYQFSGQRHIIVIMICSIINENDSYCIKARRLIV